MDKDLSAMNIAEVQVYIQTLKERLRKTRETRDMFAQNQAGALNRMSSLEAQAYVTGLQTKLAVLNRARSMASGTALLLSWPKTTEEMDLHQARSDALLLMSEEVRYSQELLVILGLDNPPPKQQSNYRGNRQGGNQRWNKQRR